MIITPGESASGPTRSNCGITRITIEQDGQLYTYEDLFVAGYTMDTGERRVTLDFVAKHATVQETK
jgi:hypothetical protein